MHLSDLTLLQRARISTERGGGDAMVETWTEGFRLDGGKSDRRDVSLSRTQ